MELSFEGGNVDPADASVELISLRCNELACYVTREALEQLAGGASHDLTPAEMLARFRDDARDIAVRKAVKGDHEPSGEVIVYERDVRDH